MKGKGWITGPALEIALKVKGGIKAGDEIYCSSCNAAHKVAENLSDGSLRLDVPPSERQRLGPEHFASIVIGWKPKEKKDG